MGLNEIYPALYARALTAKGYAAFGFDYRGFLDNEGPAGVCKLEEQVEDIRNAVVFVKTLAQVDADQIGLIGRGMAAGLVMEASAREPSVRAVAGLNGFYNSRKWLQSVYRLLNCEKKLYMINGKHNDFMFDDHPVFHALVDQLDAFFRDALKA